MHHEFKVQSSTHGQQCWVLQDLHHVREDATECEAVLWDFAGQADYRLVHTLFLADVDLALILFDLGQRVEPLKGVDYWLNALAVGVRRPPTIILIGARMDVGASALMPEEITVYCERQNIQGGYVLTSASTGDGIDHLLNRIKEHVNWASKRPTVTSQLFHRVKECILRIRQDGAIPFPDAEQPVGILMLPDGLKRQVEFTPNSDRPTVQVQLFGNPDTGAVDSDELMLAVGHLSNHGFISILRGSDGEHHILLAPEVLNNLASSFVNQARQNPQGLGALDEAQARSGGYPFPELQLLLPWERSVLLDAVIAMFVEQNICFRESLGHQTLLIFPSLINLKKKTHQADLNTREDVFYTITGAVENIYAALVVLLGYTNTFTRTNQWHNQAQYEFQEGEICGFRVVGEREGEMDIVMYYTASTHMRTQRLFQGLVESFLSQRGVSFTRFTPVVCGCGYVADRSVVIRRYQQDQATFLFCSRCGTINDFDAETEGEDLIPVDSPSLEGEHTVALARTAFETALSHLKAYLKDRKGPSCFVSYAWGNKDHERWVEKRFAPELRNAGIDVVLDRWHNAQIGANVARFIARIETVDFVVCVGTPEYRGKYENKDPGTGTVVAKEVDLIDHRLIKGSTLERTSVLPLLLAGEEKNSLPPLMRGLTYGDFRTETQYFPCLFDLVLTMYGIPFDTPAITELRDMVLTGSELQA